MSKDSKGFTLIELIASMGVASVIGLLAISIALSVIDVWNNAGDRVTSSSEAEYALEVITRDLEGTFFRETTTGDTMFAVTALRSSEKDNSGLWVDAASVARPSTTEPFDPVNHQYGWAGCWVRFFTAAPGLNAVGYQLIRTPIVGASTDVRYNLYRGVVRMDHTITAGFNLTEVGSDYVDSGVPVLGNAIEVVSPRIENILLSNVVDFGVRLYVYDDSVPTDSDAPPGLRIIFPADNLSKLDDTDEIHTASTSEGTIWNTRYPEAAEVIIRVISESGWRELRELEENGGAADWQEIVDRNSTVYRRFVDMRGSAFSG